MTEVIDIIGKKLKGEATEEELQTLEEWIAADTENKRLAEELSSTWERAGHLPELQVDVDASWQRMEISIGSTKRTRNSVGWKVAASITLLIGLSIGGYWLMRDSRQVYSAVGQPQKFELVDGSVVWLNKNSQLIAEDFTDDERDVELIGEGFFEVAKDSKRPFIIASSISTTKVVGTSFNINARDKKHVVISVVSGKVAFGNEEQTVELQAGDAAYVEPAIRIVNFKWDDKNFMAWKENKLVFNNLPLLKVVRELEEFFTVKIEVEHADILKCHYTGSFEEPEMENVIRVIATTTGLTYQIVDKKVILSGNGCPD